MHHQPPPKKPVCRTHTHTPTPPLAKAIAVFEACGALGVEARASAHIYSAVVAACGAAGRAADAERFFAAARAAGAANAVTYTAAIAARTRGGDLNGALALLQEMGAAGLAPDAVTFCTLLAAAQRCGSFAWGGGRGECVGL